MSLGGRQKRPESLCRDLKQSGVGGWEEAADSWGQRSRIEEEDANRFPIAKEVWEVLITLFWVQRGIWLDFSLEAWEGRMCQLQRKQIEWKQITAYYLLIST